MQAVLALYAGKVATYGVTHREMHQNIATALRTASKWCVSIGYQLLMSIKTVGWLSGLVFADRLPFKFLG